MNPPSKLPWWEHLPPPSAFMALTLALGAHPICFASPTNAILTGRDGTRLGCCSHDWRRRGVKPDCGSRTMWGWAAIQVRDNHLFALYWSSRSPVGSSLSSLHSTLFENRPKSKFKYSINASSSATTSVSSDSYQSPSGTFLTLISAEGVSPQYPPPNASHTYVSSGLQLGRDGQILHGNLMFSLATEGQYSSRGPTTRSCPDPERYARDPLHRLPYHIACE